LVVLSVTLPKTVTVLALVVMAPVPTAVRPSVEPKEIVSNWLLPSVIPPAMPPAVMVVAARALVALPTTILSASTTAKPVVAAAPP